ncbi:chaperonin 10-like protein [Fusarium redolens]|uniref:Chaperonin 10-like protein n=1 Tax=Fusarium redolens TaxID=48865 RepID=A0A9P9GUW2_FUSRE|nr:chaperonin 10-like protein [Fusarium redolens]KAH7244582.1 chaperonin 10-like protein [Fusarium redolens]
MKEALITPNIQVEIREVSVPAPKAGEVLVKVAVAGTNPKDWKVPAIYTKQAVNSGDDFAGVVEAVGGGVSEFKPGDRVAALHQIGTAGGSFAEYAIAPSSTTFHIPDDISFAEAATIPMAGLVASFGLYHVLGLPAPWSPARAQSNPLVIHGAGGAIGAMAIKLAKASNIHPIIATAGNSSDLISKLLNFEQGDTLVDYRQSPEKLVADIQSAIAKSGKGPAWYGLDAATNQDGASEYTGILKEALGTQPELDGRKPFVATVQGGAKVTGPVDGDYINVMVAHTGSKEQQCFGNTLSRLFTYGLANGWLTAHPIEIVEGGLQGLGDALTRLKDGKVFGKKLVVEVGRQ